MLVIVSKYFLGNFLRKSLENFIGNYFSIKLSELKVVYKCMLICVSVNTLYVFVLTVPLLLGAAEKCQKYHSHPTEIISFNKKTNCNLHSASFKHICKLLNTSAIIF